MTLEAVYFFVYQLFLNAIIPQGNSRPFVLFQFHPVSPGQCQPGDLRRSHAKKHSFKRWASQKRMVRKAGLIKKLPTRFQNAKR